MAENFRETVLGTKPVPWAVALDKEAAFNALKQLQPVLDSKERSKHRSIFFGGDGFARWTGYAVGYWLVKEYL